MPKFHFQAVLDALLPRITKNLDKNVLSQNPKLVINTYGSTEQKIVVTHTPKNNGELAHFLQTTLNDTDIPIRNIVAITTDSHKTEFMRRDNSQIEQFRIIRLASDQALLPTLFAPPPTYQYELSVKENNQAEKKLNAFCFPINSKDTLFSDDEYLPYFYNLFQQLNAGNNIAIYSTTFTGRIVHVILALCLLADFDQLFKANHPEQIANDILDRMQQINMRSGLIISRDQILDAVKLTDIIYSKYPHQFKRSPSHKVNPYTGPKLDTESDEEILLPRDRAVNQKNKGISGICRLI